MNNRDSSYKKIDLKALGERIRGLRGVESQGSFAERFGVSQVDVSRLERGSVINPPPELLFNICIRFNVNFDWLLTGEGPKEKELQVFNLIRRAEEYGASLYATNEGPLPECLIEERLGLEAGTLDNWLAGKKEGVEKPELSEEDQILKGLLDKARSVYKEGDFDVKARLRGTIDILYDELMAKKKSSTENIKKGA
ncbi:MAG: helix-turn-helix transcriptional regulator [Thermodesulfobacteriota bacterium]|nr:MAG: helix-turn-helix transcriptional regulator [Thermodesulfobacteriota bacterium]